jgi:iron-sulfur cluster insertion protein
MIDASPRISLSDSAAKRIAELREAEGNPGLMLRITVSGGGCAGFQYGFSLDSSRQSEDVVFEAGGVGVLVDETSLGLLGGSELDYVEDLMGAYFTLRNPNATSTCGCGSSFSV